MHWFTILFFAICIAFVWFAVRHEVRQQRKQAEHLRQLQASRTAVPAAEPSPECSVGVSSEIADRVLRVRASVSEFSLSPPQVNVDPSRLRPGDLLCDDLGYHLDSLAFCELQIKLEKEFGVRFRESDFSEPPTVRDVMCLVASGRKTEGPAQACVAAAPPGD